MTTLEDVKHGKQIQLHVTELSQNSGSEKGESYFCLSMKSRVEVGSLRLAVFVGLSYLGSRRLSNLLFHQPFRINLISMFGMRCIFPVIF